MAEEVSALAIARTLAADIHSGAFKPDEMLPSERHLCERFSVGRNVIREALTILQGMGLTDHSKGKRPRVNTPTLAKVMAGVGDAAQFFFSGSEGMAHLEQARLFLETSMLRYTTVHATNAQVARLLEAIDHCEAQMDEVEGFREADVQFHRVLADIPGNPIFTALHDTFVEQLMKSRAVLPDYKKRNRVSNSEHRLILAAILDQDADTAVEVLTRHLTRNYGTYFRLALDHSTEASARLNSSMLEETSNE